MKKLIKIKHWLGVVLLVATVTISCSDLEENPDFTTQENFFTTAEQLELGVNAVYDGIGYGRDWLQV